MTGLPLLQATGGPKGRGIRHGEEFADEIANNVSFYIEQFESNGVAETDARKHATRFIDEIEEFNEEYVTEMRGVAEGSDNSLEEIAMINIRHTILYSAYADGDGESNERDADGCTSFALQPEVTECGRTLIGQNWDWQKPVERLLLKAHRDDGPNYLALTEAGNVGGKFGLNEAGIAFAVNGLTTPTDGKHPYRKPAHVRAKEILNAKRLDIAIEAIIGEARPTSRNYLLAREVGEAVNIETAPDSFEFIHPTNGLLVHTNHFRRRHSVKSTLERRVPHSVPRLLRAERLFEREVESAVGVSVEDVKSILRDHVGRPRSICRHPDKEAGSLSQTNASIIMDPGKQQLWATDGPPCDSEYQQHSLNE